MFGWKQAQYFILYKIFHINIKSNEYDKLDIRFVDLTFYSFENLKTFIIVMLPTGLFIKFHQK